MWTYIIGGVVALVLIGLIRAAAAYQQKGVRQKARADFAKLDPGFEVVEAFGRHGLAYNPGTHALALWEEGQEARLLDRSLVGSWFVGWEATEFVSGAAATQFNLANPGEHQITARSARARYVFLDGTDGKPILKLGLLEDEDVADWDRYLSAALGPDTRRQTARLN
jgi:hypothetical protein